MGQSFLHRLKSSLGRDEEHVETTDVRSSYDSSDEREITNYAVSNEEEGELGVDVYDCDDFFMVKAFIPAVIKGGLDISAARQSITIVGERYDEEVPEQAMLLTEELFWGKFSRTVEFPEEIDIDHIEAAEEKGVLTVVLPKNDPHRKTRVQIG
jgi:HSP20 family protein